MGKSQIQKLEENKIKTAYQNNFFFKKKLNTEPKFKLRLTA